MTNSDASARSRPGLKMGKSQSERADGLARPKYFQRRRGSDRLSRMSWLDAGQEVLIEDGVGKLRLGALTKRLEVSTGSFYYHFADFDEFLGALARHFSKGQVSEALREAERASSTPVGRIRALAEVSARSRLWKLDGAMRVWGELDPRAAESVEAAEQLVLDFLESAFVDLGFDRSQARLRSRMLLAANVARIGAGGRERRRSFLQDALQLLLAGALCAGGALSD